MKACIPNHATKNASKAQIWANLQWSDFERVLNYEKLADQNRKRKIPPPDRPKDVSSNARSLMNTIKIIKSNFAHTKEHAIMARNKLFAIMNEEGTPNFWITMNANVHNNKFLITVQNGDIFEGHPTQEERLKAVSQNPALLAIYFRRLVEAFLKYFIGFNTKTKTP